jgi:hypothetical protein
MSEQLLAALNPGKKFDCAGEAIVVVDTGVGEGGESRKRTVSRWTRPGRL